MMYSNTRTPQHVDNPQHAAGKQPAEVAGPRTHASKEHGLQAWPRFPNASGLSGEVLGASWHVSLGMC